MKNDKRLIEDFLPIKNIKREGANSKGHIAKLHLWWARRPLVACRAAVYGALVPANQFVPNNGSDHQKKSLGRANAAKFITELCKYPGDPKKIKDAERHILEAHADRLTEETGQKVTYEDIVEGRAPKPKVLDMFAGGGAIPFEALRLGCETYALDLNPVAHIIELCTLVYPQKYGKPDPDAKGMTGPKNQKGETTWGGLADEVKYWGHKVISEVKREIGGLYPAISDPDRSQKIKEESFLHQIDLFQEAENEKMLISNTPTNKDEIPYGYLIPIGFFYTRTVKCKKPSCGSNIPLLKQTWLCNKEGCYIAFKPIYIASEKKVEFEVAKSNRESDLGFDPSEFSKVGNAVCPFCGTVADNNYIKGEGLKKKIGIQIMGAVCLDNGGPRNKKYISFRDFSESFINKSLLNDMFDDLKHLMPFEKIEPNPRSMDIHRFGYTEMDSIYTQRQLVYFACCVKNIKNIETQLSSLNFDDEYIDPIICSISVAMSKTVIRNNSFVIYHTKNESIEGPMGDGKFPMAYDFVEANPLYFEGESTFAGSLSSVCEVIKESSSIKNAAIVNRGNATDLNFQSVKFDAIITDPPYYDNISYSNLSDFFYVWLKRVLPKSFGQHISNLMTPKKNEIIAAKYRHLNDKAKANDFYEKGMANFLCQAGNLLKTRALLTCVYAHKTTLGWSTLIEAMRTAHFEVQEAWPLVTEVKGGRKKVGHAMLASSIFIVARLRQGSETGSYEEVVRPELEEIVRERVKSLWDMGITGADLIIAAVGAGLRAFTRFARVEFANGEEMPAEKFLAQVEGVVLETMMEKIFRIPKKGVATVDGESRFYVLWRYTYKNAEMDAGEAIVFTYGQHVELDGPDGLSSGSRSLVEKKKGKYRLKDFTERGDDEKLGLPDDKGISAPLIDILHRTLWLMENQPKKLAEFLAEARPDVERLRLVAQTLSGAGLSGKTEEESEYLISTTATEQSTLGKLLANWKSLIESRLKGTMI